jgi:hypothetical protein
MDNKFWDFAAVVVVCIFLYFIIKEIVPYCREISVKKDANGNVEFTALTHDKEEIADENPPLVLQGN